MAQKIDPTNPAFFEAYKYALEYGLITVNEFRNALLGSMSGIDGGEKYLAQFNTDVLDRR